MDTMASSQADDDWLPDPPEKPLPSDCCGSGCTPCVLDIYEEEMSRFLKMQSLSPEERQLRSKSVSNLPSALSPVNYSALSLGSIVRETNESVIFTFHAAPERSLSVSTGQHVVVRANDRDGCPISRQYTPIGPLHEKNSFQVLIKLYPGGAMSQAAAKWSIGAEVDWKGPFGGFHYEPNKHQRLVLLACGTGIAPMINIVRSILENEEEETRIDLLYACRTQHDIFLKDAIDEFKTYWNFSVVYFLSKSSDEDSQLNKGRLKYGDVICCSRVTNDTLWKYLKVDPSANCMVLICGTESFDKDMISFLESAGFDRTKYFKF